jgi:hypothetical protein
MIHILKVKPEVLGCGKKFWSCYYGASLLGPLKYVLGWHRVRCGTNYFFEGKALCEKCRGNKL